MRFVLLLVLSSPCLIACAAESASAPFCAAAPPFDAFEENHGGELCNDGDPCTDDFCDRALDRCVFVPKNATRACQNDNQCDDDQACTDDSCALDECGNLRCRNLFRSDCHSCDEDVGNTCDDGNECTTERCEDHACIFERVPLCEMLCGRGQFPGGSWFSDPELDAYRTGSGTATLAARPGEPCPTPNACACDGDLSLSGHLRVVAADGSSLSCTIDRCEDGPAVATCDTLFENRSYVVWGHPMSDDAVPLEGFCLTMSKANLLGHYVGQLHIGEAEVALTAEGVPEPNERGLTHLAFRLTLDCDDCGYTLPEPVVVPTLTPQALTVVVPLSDTSGTHDLAGTMYPSGNALVGNLSDGTLAVTLRLELVDPDPTR